MFLPLLLIFVAAFASPHVSSASPSSALVYNRTLFALLALETSIDPLGLVLSSWNSSSLFCTWLGITCGPYDSHIQVMEITLQHYYALKGTLSPQIANLQELISLDLSGNQLSGQLPSSLGQIESLQYLDLSGNQLSGQLPTSLGHIKNLHQLNLSKNHLKGTLSPQIANLRELISLDLSGNQLSGQLPSSLGQMESLQYLDLSGNQLSGQLPTSLGQMKNLQQLTLSKNHLKGTLSPQIANLQELITLDLAGNQLSGQLPSSLGQMKSLKNLILSNNHLSGQLPSSLGQMESLEYLLLSSNQLKGTLSPQIGNLQELSTLDLSGNRLSGQLPSSLGQMESLEVLDLSGNQLSGELPSSLRQMKSLQVLDLSRNLFFGPLPSFLLQMESLTYLNLSNNQLSGELPSSLGQMKSQLEVLDLSRNQFSGPLPSSLDSLFSLTILDVSYNRLQGSIPPRLYQQFLSHSFRGNPGLHGPNDHASKRSIIVVVVCATAGPVLTSCLMLCVWRYCFKNRKHPGLEFVAPHYKAWTAEEMRAATNNFDAANVIGSGAVSTCYLGAMNSPQGSITRVVAFKRITVDECELGEADEARESFVNEFKTLCKVRHRNLVKVLGYCMEGPENIALVMEYMEGGDLDRRLHMNEARKLRWEERVNVALDVAEGLVYLHHEYEQPIIHCDVKPKNILLGADMVAKISDFGIARLVERKEREDIRAASHPVARGARAASDNKGTVLTVGSKLGTAGESVSGVGCSLEKRACSRSKSGATGCTCYKALKVLQKSRFSSILQRIRRFA